MLLVNMMARIFLPLPLVLCVTLIFHVRNNVCLSWQSHKVATNYMPHRSELMVEAVGQNIHSATLLWHFHQLENESDHQNSAADMR